MTSRFIRLHAEIGRWFIRLLFGGAAALLVLAGIAYVAARFVLWPNLEPLADRHVKDIEQAIGVPIKWDSIETRWTGLMPELRVVSLAVGAGAHPVRLAEARATFSWRSLVVRAPVFHSIELQSPQIHLERKGDLLSVPAFEQASSQEPPKPRSDGRTPTQAALAWVGMQESIVVRDARVALQDLDDASRSLRIDGLMLTLTNAGRAHALELKSPPVDGLSDAIALSADLHRASRVVALDSQDWTGRAQMNVGALQLPSLVRQLPLSLQKQLADASGVESLWARVKGKVDASLQVDLSAGERQQLTLDLRSDSLVTPAAPMIANAAIQRNERARVDDRARGENRPVRDTSWKSVDLQFQFEQTAVQRSLALNRVKLDAPGEITLEGEGAPTKLVLDRSDGAIRELALQLKALELGRLQSYLAPWLENGPAQRWNDALTVDGSLLQPALAWRSAAAAASDTAQWQFRTRLDRAIVYADLGALKDDTPPARADRKARAEAARSLFAGIHLLNGEIAATETGGQMRLDADRAAPKRNGARAASAVDAEQPALLLGGIMPDVAIELDRLRTAIGWSMAKPGDPSTLKVDIQSLELANRELNAKVQGSYARGGKAGGIVDLGGSVENAQLNKVWRYLPYELEADVRDWVHRALLGGTITQGSFVLKGDLDDFPYRDPSTGNFRVDARLRDAELQFDPKWPAIQKIQGSYRMDRGMLQVTADKGAILDAQLGPTTARIDDLRRPDLKVDGKLSGDLATMLRYVNATPLVKEIGALTQSMQARGPAVLNLGLTVPLNNVDEVRVNGRVDVQRSTVRLDEALPAFEDIAGRFGFTEKGFVLDGVRGQFLGGPIEAKGRTGQGGSLSFEASGKVSGAGLNAWNRDPITARLTGSTSYRARYFTDSLGPQLHIESDLVGLQSRLPAPVTKAADVAWPTVVTLGRVAGDAEGSERLRAKLGANLVMDALRQKGRGPNARSRVVRAVITNMPEPALPDEGTAFRFTGERLDVDAWQEVFAAGAGTGAGAGTAAGTAASAAPAAAPAPAPAPRGSDAGGKTRVDSATAGANATSSASGAAGGKPAEPAAASDDSFLPLDTLAINLIASELHVARRDLHKVVLGGSRENNHWRLNVASEEANGYVDWYEARPGVRQGRVLARFDLLRIPESKTPDTTKEPQPTASTESLPAIDLQVRRVVLGDIELGSVAVQATNRTRRSAGRPIWEIEDLKVENPGGTLNAKGRWDNDTALRYELAIRDSGILLERFGVKGAINGGPGSLKGELHWNGAPTAFDLKTLGGNVAVDIGKGRFLKVDPGAAKLIGVLNLQALPRLLSFDFSGTFGKGFAFDNIAGDVEIEKGVARTGSLAMKGLQAVVQLKGETDLAAATQDMNVTVVPDLNAGLATLAFTVINPAVGLGAFVASSLLGDSIGKAMAFEFDIKGSWQDPTIRQLKGPGMEDSSAAPGSATGEGALPPATRQPKEAAPR